jgi:hypothetical protein
LLESANSSLSEIMAYRERFLFDLKKRIEDAAGGAR